MKIVLFALCILLPLACLGAESTVSEETVPYWKTLPEPIPYLVDYAYKTMFNEETEVQ